MFDANAKISAEPFLGANAFINVVFQVNSMMTATQSRNQSESINKAVFLKIF